MKQLPHKTSLVSQTAAILREEILSGAWEKWLPGEHELCAELQVSRVTLRAALDQLRREGRVRSSRGKRREVVNAPKRRASSSREVAVLMPASLETTEPFTMFWIDSLREQLGAAGYHLGVHARRAAYSRHPARTLTTLMERVRPAAWVLCDSTAQIQHRFSASAVPCVIAGSRHSGVNLPSVDVNYRVACRHAVGQFLAKGHHRLVFINPASGLAGDLESEVGFLEGAAQTKRADLETRIIRHDSTTAGVCRELAALLRRPNPPTGFLVSLPTHVLTVMGYLMSHGHRFPRDVTLISRDSSSVLLHMYPGVARYEAKPAFHARKLSKAVLALVRGEVVAATEHKIIPQFIPGESLG